MNCFGSVPLKGGFFPLRIDVSVDESNPSSDGMVPLNSLLSKSRVVIDVKRPTCVHCPAYVAIAVEAVADIKILKTRTQ